MGDGRSGDDRRREPLILSAVTRLAGEYLAPGDRADGIAVGSAGNFVGMLIALLLGPLIGGHGHLERLLAIEAALTVAAAIALAVALRRPGLPSAERTVIEGSAVRALWRLPELRTLVALVFLGFGIFVAIATWLQTLLQPSGVSDTAAGALLVGMVIAGVVGCAAIAPTVSERRAERRFMLWTVGVSLPACLICGAAVSLAVRAVALVAIGLLLLSALPVVLTACERLAGGLAATAGAIVWMAGNLGGLLVALIVQVLVHHTFAAFAAMALVALLGLPLALRVPAGTLTAEMASAGP